MLVDNKDFAGSAVAVTAAVGSATEIADAAVAVGADVGGTLVLVGSARVGAGVEVVALRD
jgi:hypothetical protein